MLPFCYIITELCRIPVGVVFTIGEEDAIFDNSALLSQFTKAAKQQQRQQKILRGSHDDLPYDRQQHFDQ